MRESYRPDTLEEALIYLKNTRSLPYAGGTDLMPRGRRWIGVRPRCDAPFLFIGHLSGLQNIQRQGDALAIGAGCTLARLADQEDVPTLLRQVISLMAAPGVRNLATIGGNICNASPAGDTLPYLYAMDAWLVVKSASTTRQIPVADFILGPGKTSLAEDELLTDILVPLAEWDVVDYQRVASRQANAPSKVSFLGLARKSGKRVEDLRLAFGAVGATVIRSAAAEKELVEVINAVRAGKCSRDNLTNCAISYDRILQPIDDRRGSAGYRRQVALNLLHYFLKNLCH